MQKIKAKQLLRSIFADSSDKKTETDEELLCHANQDDLSAYIDAELDGLNAATFFPELHDQIKTCESCRIAHFELTELFLMDREGTFVEPPLALRPLGFPSLVAEPVDSIAKPSGIEVIENAIRWQLDALGQMILTLSDDFLSTLHPAAQPVYLKSSPRDLFEVSSPDMAEDLAVTLVARELKSNAEQCAITITADIPSRGGWPHLGDTEVILKIGGQATETQYTDAFGKAAFAGIGKGDLPRLSITVVPGEQ